MSRQTKYPDMPLLPKGWKTGNMMHNEYGGTVASWNLAMENLQIHLVGDIVAIGIPEPQAEDLVNTYFVGDRRHSFGQPAIAMSPATQEMLLETEPSRLPPEWQTSQKRENTHGGKHQLWDKYIRELSEALVGDIVASKAMNEEDARHFVRERFVKLCRHQHGRPAMGGSPEAWEMVEVKYKVKKRKPRAGKDETVSSDRSR